MLFQQISPNQARIGLADFHKWLARAVVGDSHDIEALVLIAMSQYRYVQHVLVPRPRGSRSLTSPLSCHSQSLTCQFSRRPVFLNEPKPSRTRDGCGNWFWHNPEDAWSGPSIDALHDTGLKS